MPTVPLSLLSAPANRDRALELIRAAGGLPLPVAQSVVLTLDSVSGTVLSTAGVSPVEARPVLDALWRYPQHIEDRPTRTTVVRPVGEAEYLAGLAERIHVIRRARRMTTSGVCRRLGISPVVMQDLEAGVVCPTLPMLLRVADVFQVPVAMLADHHATPLRILRLLAAAQAA